MCYSPYSIQSISCGLPFAPTFSAGNSRSVLPSPSSLSNHLFKHELHYTDYMFVRLLGFKICHIAIVPACSSGTLTNVLPHINAMMQTQDMTQYTDIGPTCHCAIHCCGTSHWNTKLPISMSWVRPDQEILPQSSTHTSEHSTLSC